MLSPEQHVEIEKILIYQLEQYRRYLCGPVPGDLLYGDPNVDPRDKIAQEALAAISAVMEQTHIVAGNNMGSTGVIAPSQSDELLESCYVALWEAIEDSATARRLEHKFKDAIRALNTSKPPATEATKAYTPVEGDIQDKLMALGRKYKIVSKVDDPNVFNDEMLERFKRELLVVIQTQLDAAYQRGRIDEAKTCEEAKRHDTKGLYTQAQLNEAVREARIDERNVAIQELRDELEKVRANKALTPDGINGYWSAIRDFSLNNGDRLQALTNQSKPKENG